MHTVIEQVRRIARHLPLVARRSRRRLWEYRWSDPEEVPNWLIEAARPQLTAAVDDGWISSGSSVVEIGCGLGHGAAFLASVGCEVLGLDLSETAIDRARSLHRHVNGLTFKQADITTRLPDLPTYDIVVDMGCFHALPVGLQPAYGRNVRRLTHPGSHLIFFMRPLRSQTIDDKVLSLTDVLGADFEVVTVTPEEQPPEWSNRKGAEVRVRRAAVSTA